MTGVMTTLHIKASTATSLVNRLETLGFVRRSRNPRDRRSLLVELTDDGIQCAGRVLPAFEAVDSALAGSAQDLTLARVSLVLDQLSADG
ncbi:DNA-binding MarR family transcriptional regulator [Saccharomonospora amisosensis]|uniref:DNA-binding MarR family transcriptional regulator n=2 Tax=Saccharomonospora amisosensis TaxID=1128677 RepID=A0A7X5ZQL6_9PSEU|nr:DNA-binding MarR family transcriptional regulator [Saccharomonospora amisosensis]